MERRSIAGEVKSETVNEKRAIVGHAAVYYDGTPGTEFRLLDNDPKLGTVVERIMPGAFAAAAENDDVRALFNHDPNMVLGRSKAGTLKLRPDSRGLSYEINPPDTQYARDLQTSLDRGDISGSSFGFEPIDRSSVTWSKERRGEDLVRIRELRGVRLFDVGPVTFPAYGGASSGMRAAGEIDRDAIAVECAEEPATGGLSRAAADATLRVRELQSRALGGKIK